MDVGKQSFVFAGADKETTECQVFQAFYDIQPNFAGRPLKDWERGADPPDILCHDFSGKHIGVEITEWINEKQIAVEKARQRLHASFSRIIRSESETPPRNLEHVTLELNGESLPPESEQSEFRRELFDCIRNAGASRDASPDRRSLQDWDQREFPNHPSLSKYVAWIKYWPCRPSENTPPGVEWVRFPTTGRFYDPRAMLDPLLTNIRKKTANYSTLRGQQALDELYLIVYYSKALLYNQPYSAPGFGFRDVAEAAGEVLSQNPGPFQRVFLFSPVERDQKVVQVWPRDAIAVC
jgi:hypothetical protein